LGNAVERISGTPVDRRWRRGGVDYNVVAAEDSAPEENTPGFRICGPVLTESLQCRQGVGPNAQRSALPTEHQAIRLIA
jgi:hypothetical protein